MLEVTTALLLRRELSPEPLRAVVALGILAAPGVSAPRLTPSTPVDTSYTTRTSTETWAAATSARGAASPPLPSCLPAPPLFFFCCRPKKNEQAVIARTQAGTLARYAVDPTTARAVPPHAPTFKTATCSFSCCEVVRSLAPYVGISAVCVVDEETQRGEPVDALVSTLTAPMSKRGACPGRAAAIGEAAVGIGLGFGAGFLLGQVPGFYVGETLSRHVRCRPASALISRATGWLRIDCPRVGPRLKRAVGYSARPLPDT